ncbi:siroheme synthase CysG [Jannaschia marina]|uniref:siroheme synthase CysG n=1 Tax=Jannaschia marina TaxID=2741674 RepID=UPI0015CE4B25|nr:siroheme synthase CysG [Jannaschia marina]
MKSFPMFLRLEGRHVVIAGGGEQAAQKARLMLKTETRIVLLADTLEPELADLVASGRAEQDVTPPTAAHFAGAALVFVATGCPGRDAALHALAKAAGATVNVVDQPALCDATTPSIVDRSPLVVAIGTEGAAPVLARQLRARIERDLAPNLGGLAALAGRLRGAVAAGVPKAKRRDFWRWVFDGAARATWERGAEREAAQAIKTAIAGGGAPDVAEGGSIALVGAGPGAADLLTLRALRHLQEADMIFYDRLVDPAVLDLARRDAERVYVGKAVGACAWPQDRINDVITAAARSGQRVVRLKSGDPAVFGRAEEELAAARAHGVPVEIVPGITAASAAAAAIGRSLTERGQTDRVTFATGTTRPGDTAPDWAGMLLPGTTLALYMAARAAPEIAARLLSEGVPGDTPVDVISEASRSGETHARMVLRDLGTAEVAAPAVVFITRAKTAAASLPARPRLVATA